jgi:hypothetical protein
MAGFRDLSQPEFHPDVNRLAQLRLKFSEASEIRELFPLGAWERLLDRAREREAQALGALSAPGVIHDPQHDAEARGRLDAIRWLLGLPEEIRKERETLSRAIAQAEAPQTEGSMT